MEADNVDMAKAERILNAVGQTYKHPAADIARLILQEPYTHLVLIYSKERNAEKTIAMALKTIESLGFFIKGAQLPLSADEEFRAEKWGIITDDVVSMFGLLWNAYAAFRPSLVE